MSDKYKNRFVGFGKSDTGQARTFNADHFCTNTSLGLYCVADGVGDSDQAARASNSVIESTRKTIEDWHGANRSLTEDLGNDLLRSLDSELFEMNLADQLNTPLASTLTAIILTQEKSSLILHVGDSKLYGFSPDRLSPLTEDHTLANDLRKQGMTEFDPASEHALVNCIGRMRSEWNEVHKINASLYEAFLLCSDGLSKVLSDDQIAATMNTSWYSPNVCVDELISTARDAGSEDNITVIVVIRERDIVE